MKGGGRDGQGTGGKKKDVSFSIGWGGPEPFQQARRKKRADIVDYRVSTAQKAASWKARHGKGEEGGVGSREEKKKHEKFA